MGAKMGRPKGRKDSAPRNTAARKQAAAAAAEGITPLDVMLRDMRRRWAQGEAAEAQAQAAADAGEADAALEARDQADTAFALAANRASDAAPYCHARLSATTVKHEDALSNLTDEQLASLLALAERFDAGRPSEAGPGGDHPTHH